MQSHGLAYLHKNTVHFFNHGCSLSNYFQALISVNLFCTISFTSLIYKVTEKAQKFSFMPL